MLSNHSRRSFLQQLSLITVGLLVKDSISPTSVSANEIGKIREKYLVSVPFLTGKSGGNQSITLYSGALYSLKIPSRIKDKAIIIKDGYQFDLRTLYDREAKIGDKIFNEIDSTNLISASSKTKCKFVYEQIEDCQPIDDVSTLELLDYIIGTSGLSEDICQRYQIASNQSRWVKIGEILDNKLASSSQPSEQKALLRGTLELIESGQPISDFKALTKLDSIVLDSKLSESFKQSYTYGSTFCRAITVDYLILESIGKLDDVQKQQYLLTYEQVRAGSKDIDTAMLSELDTFIYNDSKLSANAQVVYKEARDQSLGKDGNLADTIKFIIDRGQDLKDIKNDLDRASGTGSAIIPTTTKLLSAAAIEAGTGVSIGTLTGAAATNATLAWLGGGSVATGGLGMLGGLTVATGGAALIGAAGIVSFGLLTQMDGNDFKNLGVAVGGGTVLAGGVAFLAWTAATATGVAGSLSGAAAITATMTALGGLSVMTGGTAAVALGGAYVIWSLLDGDNKRNQGILEELETKIYTLAQVPNTESIAGSIISKIGQQYQYAEVFSFPELPLNLLANAHKSWLKADEKETVIALIDTSLFNDAKQGVIFTEKRIIWKKTLQDSDYLSYSEFAKILKTQGLAMLDDDESRHNLDKLYSLANIFSDDQDKEQFNNFLQQIGEQCLAMTTSF